MAKSSSQSSGKNSFNLNNEIFLLIIIILAVVIILFFNKDKCANEGFQNELAQELEQELTTKLNTNNINVEEEEDAPVKYLKVENVIFNNEDATISIILIGGVTLTVPETEFDENTNIKNYLKNNVINEKINEILNREIKRLNQELKNKQTEIDNYKSDTNKMIESEYIVREACPENKCPTYVMPKVNVSAGLCKEKVCPKPVETKCTTVEENIIYKVYENNPNNTATTSNNTAATSNNTARTSNNNQNNDITYRKLDHLLYINPSSGNNNTSSNERRNNNNTSSNQRPKSVLNNNNINELNHDYRTRAQAAGLL